MPEILYRLDPHGRLPDPPADAEGALARLHDGNLEFQQLFEKRLVLDVPPDAFGISPDGGPIAQTPFAAFLGCADARAPIEMIFRCSSNELFVVRVAGNVPGSECLGSLEYAAANLSESMRVVVVLGHTGCGAVTAGVDAYLDPRLYPRTPALRAVVDRILPAVRAAEQALAAAHGVQITASPRGRDALIGASVVLNAALGAMTVRDGIPGLPVRYGVFDLVSRRAELAVPPSDAEAFLALSREVAERTSIRATLTS
jgi:carbonic anhydrase